MHVQFELLIIDAINLLVDTIIQSTHIRMNHQHSKTPII